MSKVIECGLIVVVLLAGLTGTVDAQQVILNFDRVGQDKDAPKLTPEEREKVDTAIETAVAAELTRIAIAELQLEIKSIQRLFKLSATDVKRLQLAARGASSRAVDAAAARNKATLSRLIDRRIQGASLRTLTVNGEKLALESDPESGEADDEPPAKPSPAIIIARRGASFSLTVKHATGSSSSSLYPRDTELRGADIWTRTFNKVLTAEQRREYEKFRLKEVHDMAVAVLVGVIGYEVRISKEQLPEFRNVVSDNVNVTAATLVSGPDYVCLLYTSPSPRD